MQGLRGRGMTQGVPLGGRRRSHDQTPPTTQQWRISSMTGDDLGFSAAQTDGQYIIYIFFQLLKGQTAIAGWFLQCRDRVKVKRLLKGKSRKMASVESRSPALRLHVGGPLKLSSPPSDGHNFFNFSAAIAVWGFVFCRTSCIFCVKPERKLFCRVKQKKMQWRHYF